MRIALATVGTTGDAGPFAILARALVARGDEVTIVSWPVHREILAVADSRFVGAGPHGESAAITATADAAASASSPMRQVAILRDFHLIEAEAHYRALRESLPGHDLVVIHGIHALAHAVALDAGLRFATAVFDPVLLPTASAPPAGVPNLGPLNRLAWAFLDRMLARASSPLTEVLTRVGSAQRGLPLFRARSPLLHLVACSPSIIRVPPDLPAGTHVTGAWLDDESPAPLPADVEEFLATGPPPVVVTFGSMAGIDADALRGAVARLTDAGHRVVVQADVDRISPAPGVAVIGPIDHRALFPRAAVVLHHGGAGTTHAAVAAGVPSVVVPHIGDQAYWADRLRRLGAAPRPIPVRSLTADRVVSAVTEVLAYPSYRSRTDALGAAVRAEDGIGLAVGLLEHAAAD
jgi:sterol 3beta-glucosyltransferase